MYIFFYIKIYKYNIDTLHCVCVERGLHDLGVMTQRIYTSQPHTIPYCGLRSVALTDLDFGKDANSVLQ